MTWLENHANPHVSSFSADRKPLKEREPIVEQYYFVLGEATLVWAPNAYTLIVSGRN